MASSLSVLLPVHNAQDRLERQLTQVLDVLPDLSERFEVLIIDDGSTDDTRYVAYDLATRYPQVGVIRHQQRRGIDQAVRTGMAIVRNDNVLVHHDESGLTPLGVVS